VTDKAYTVNEFISTHKVSRTKVYEEIKAGHLATYNVGRRRFISAHAADQWQRNLEKQSQAGRTSA
jgi:excisionase family DNA binding protein